MKLGTQTGSVINHLQARAVIGQPAPKAGMGATVLMWTDRSAVTIFRVFQSGKSTIIETRDDHERVISGSTHDGTATWAHKVNVAGYRRHFRSEKDGRWVEVRKDQTTNRWGKTGGYALSIGKKETYRDPGF